jgi:carboxyl-terminal processing protease
MLDRKLKGKNLFLILALILTIVSTSLFFGWKLGYLGIDLFSFGSSRKTSADLGRVINLINKEYFREFDQKAGVEFAIKKLVESLNDPYSYYVSKEEYQRFLQEKQQGEFHGIGIIFSLDNQHLLILEVLLNSPAEKVGLKNGDQITKINGINIVDFENEVAVVNRLRSEEEKSVELEILSGSETKTVIIEKSKFSSPSLVYKKLDNKIGYLKIYQFVSNINEEFSTISNQLKEDEIEKLVIDLRNNAGGITNSEIYLLDQFIDSQTLMKKIHKDSEILDIEASEHTPFKEINLVILTNTNTASSAEVFAAAIKDNNRGKLVGERTKGKSTEQAFFELTDGSAIRITTAKWLTPKGESVREIGVIPNIEVEDEIINDKDLIFEKALQQF